MKLTAHPFQITEAYYVLRFFRQLTSLVLCLLLTTPAQAFFETAETGEISRVGTYKLGAMPQIRLSEGSGMNFTGFFDTPLREDQSLRILLGLGETDFYTGGSFKWIPIPDYLNQPALGFKIEALYGRKSSDSLVSFRFHPIVSKRFSTDHGVFTPYGSLPVGVSSYRSSTDSQINLVIGSEYTNLELHNIDFGAEIGMNALKSFSYISGYVTFLMDEKVGFKTKK